MGKSKELAELGDVVTQSGGNVGIGTQSPYDALHVMGTIRSEVTNSGDENLRLTTIGGGGLVVEPDDPNTANPSWEIRTFSNEPLNLQVGGVTRLGIDASGRVTMPYQPAFTVRSNGGFKNTAGVVPYEIAEVNVGNCYSTSNYRFTAPISGKYLFSWFGLLGPNQTNGAVGQVTLYMRVNGGIWITYHSNGDDYWDQSGGTAIASLTSGDYVDIYLNSGGLYFGDNANGYSKFSGYLIG